LIQEIVVEVASATSERNRTIYMYRCRRLKSHRRIPPAPWKAKAGSPSCGAAHQPGADPATRTCDGTGDTRTAEPAGAGAARACSDANQTTGGSDSTADTASS